MLPGLPVSLSHVALLEFLVFITAPNVVPPMEDAAAIDATGEATSGKYLRIRSLHVLPLLTNNI